MMAEDFLYSAMNKVVLHYCICNEEVVKSKMDRKNE